MLINQSHTGPCVPFISRVPSALKDQDYCTSQDGEWDWGTENKDQSPETAGIKSNQKQES
jgi:hypothetical protein